MEEIEALKEALEKQRAQYEGQIAALRLDFAVENALLKAGARNCRAAGALLDKNALAFDDSGEVTGLREQIEALKSGENTAFLFEKEPQPSIKGLVPFEGAAGAAEGNEQMSYSRFCEIYSS